MTPSQREDYERIRREVFGYGQSDQSATDEW
jgi:hypothetical protein